MITLLSIRHTWNPPVSHIASLQQILQVATLFNVRKYVLSGMGHVFRASYHTPAFTSTLDFLARQPPRELHLLIATAVPPTVVLRQLSTAPRISFFRVSVEKDGGTSSDTSQPSKCAESGGSGRGIGALRRLFVYSLDYLDPSAKLTCAAASTLEHIHLHIGCRFSRARSPCSAPPNSLSSWIDNRPPGWTMFRPPFARALCSATRTSPSLSPYPVEIGRTITRASPMERS
ncbi:hypothetical protein DFH08DRAFT_846166 [Mycena albidolilacea]|uniref:Uncharacterized protein n=1 Tax=Mycena albidolilacea TaxID=1033008 RepID=A0AAD7AI64_9AGAR|nr:hypothetical protein DFH08DRAFT_846166 [Mycena albidolilacea]